MSRVKTLPATNRSLLPLMNEAILSVFDPANCTAVTSSAPSPHCTVTPSLETQRIVPVAPVGVDGEFATVTAEATRTRKPSIWLVHGSADGGRTVKNADAEALQHLRTLGRSIGLKTHECQSVEIPLAADVECHRGLDGSAR